MRLSQQSSESFRELIHRENARGTPHATGTSATRRQSALQWVELLQELPPARDYSTPGGEYKTVSRGRAVGLATTQWDFGVTQTDAPFSVTAIDQPARTITVSGQFSTPVVQGQRITVDASTGNDGTYELSGSAEYDSTLDETTLSVRETLPDATADGNVSIVYDMHWPITAVDQTAKTITVSWTTDWPIDPEDVTSGETYGLDRVMAGSVLAVSRSSGNDRTYTAAQAVTYDATTQTITVTVNEAIADATADGELVLITGAALSTLALELTVVNRSRNMHGAAGDIVGCDLVNGEWTAVTIERPYLQGYITDDATGGLSAPGTGTLQVWEMDTRHEWKQTGRTVTVTVRGQTLVTRGQWVVVSWDRGEWIPLSGAPRNQSMVRVRNAYAYHLPRLSPVGLDYATDDTTPIDEDGRHAYEDGLVTLQCTVPSSRHKQSQIGVLLQPLDPGEDGWAAIDGVVTVRSDRIGGDRPVRGFAQARPGITTYLPEDHAQYGAEASEHRLYVFESNPTHDDTDSQVANLATLTSDYGTPQPFSVIQHVGRYDYQDCTSCEATVECQDNRWRVTSTALSGGGDCSVSCQDEAHLVPEQYAASSTATPCTDGATVTLPLLADRHNLSLVRLDPHDVWSFSEFPPGPLPTLTEYCAHHRCRYNCVETSPGTWEWLTTEWSEATWGSAQLDPSSFCQCDDPPAQFLCGESSTPTDICLAPKPISIVVPAGAGCSGSVTVTCGHCEDGGYSGGDTDPDPVTGVGAWSGWCVTSSTCTGGECGCDNGGTPHPGAFPLTVAPKACDYCNKGDTYTASCSNYVSLDPCLNQPTVTCPGYCLWTVAPGNHPLTREANNSAYGSHVNRWVMARRVKCEGTKDLIDPTVTAEGDPVVMTHDGPCGCGDWPTGAWFQRADDPTKYVAGTSDPVGTQLVYDCGGVACV